MEGLNELITEILEEPAEAEAIPEAAAAETAPVVVETPVEQPVIVDCGPQILEALERIISLLSGANPQTDCNGEQTEDEEADPTEGAQPETAVQELAENLAEAAVEAVVGVMEPGLADEDPVEELVAEILESGTEESPLEPGTGEILSGILEPEDTGDEDPEDPDRSAQAADALRAAFAGFRPQLARMRPKERQRFNADVARRMKELTASSNAGGKPNPYAALKKTAVHDHGSQDLGRKIMAARNVNLRTR